ncbi:MAG: DUF2066 domain-containing protein [Alcanivoracaceae bacterium]|nr:DUF2066 domain-containing protein [Alcanivoracaceae bacterium]
MRVWLTFLFGVMSVNLLCAVASEDASAADLKLGAVQVPVADRSSEARAEALSMGIDQVLVRLTGSRELGAIDGLGPIRSQPSRWAQQFSYTQLADDQLGLNVNFDLNAVLGALERSGAPVWGVTRPQILVWLALQRPGYGEIVGRDMSDPVALALSSAAQERGLPLVMPLMDDKDRGTINVADIRGHFDNVIQQASARYQAPVRVSAVIYTGARPQIRWRLFRGTEILDQGEFTADDEPLAVRRLVDEIADRLASVYVIKSGSGEAQVLTVSGVRKLGDWSALQQYLQKLTGVSGVNMLQVKGEQVRFSLMFSGSLDQLTRMLALYPGLAPCPVGAADLNSEVSAPVALPAYCWQGG